MAALPSFRILTGPVLAGMVVLAVSATPAMAKKTAPDLSETGGLFQPPAPIIRPSLVMDTLIPKAEAHAVVTPAAAPARPVAQTVAAKPADQPRTIAGFRIFGLFE